MRVSGVTVVVFLLMYSPVVVGSGDSGDAAFPDLTLLAAPATIWHSDLFSHSISWLIPGKRIGGV